MCQYPLNSEKRPVLCVQCLTLNLANRQAYSVVVGPCAVPEPWVDSGWWLWDERPLGSRILHVIHQGKALLDTFRFLKYKEIG